MSQPSRNQYLESKVLTASQPQLHMMLLEGALRFGRNAKEMWTDGADFHEVDQELERTADLIDELTHGAASADTEISQQLEEQYAFMYRELAACRINQDPQRLDTCLQLLTFQRETWRLACELLENESSVQTQPNAAPIPIPHTNANTNHASVGLSLEA